MTVDITGFKSVEWETITGLMLAMSEKKEQLPQQQGPEDESDVWLLRAIDLFAASKVAECAGAIRECLLTSRSFFDFKSLRRRRPPRPPAAAPAPPPPADALRRLLPLPPLPAAPPPPAENPSSGSGSSSGSSSGGASKGVGAGGGGAADHEERAEEEEDDEGVLREAARAAGSAHGPGLAFYHKVVIVMHPEVQLASREMRITMLPTLEAAAESPAVAARTRAFLDRYFPVCGGGGDCGMSDSGILMHALCNKFIFLNDDLALEYFKKTPATSVWFPVAVHQQALYYFYSCKAVEKNYPLAVSMFQQARGLGNTNATFSLGYCYDHGTGVDSDPTTACALYTEASEKGNLLGTHNLSLLVKMGRGTTRNLDKALELCQKAAKGGNFYAMLDLSAQYCEGRGALPKDMKMAEKLWRRAAKRGSVSACTLLVELYSRGLKGLPQSDSKSAFYLHLATLAGCKTSPGKLAKLYLSGTGVKRSALTAKDYAMCFAKRGNDCNDLLQTIEKLIGKQNQAIALLLGHHTRTGRNCVLMILPLFFLEDAGWLLIHM
ncbi:sel1 repeat family protein [Pelomyxa schiedti]|nr:sel1 repeat family protein [Pelomyxa schiedti]